MTFSAILLLSFVGFMVWSFLLPTNPKNTPINSASPNEEFLKHVQEHANYLANQKGTTMTAAEAREMTQETQINAIIEEVENATDEGRSYVIFPDQLLQSTVKELTDDGYTVTWENGTTRVSWYDGNNAWYPNNTLTVSEGTLNVKIVND